jgi:hypothetical protein
MENLRKNLNENLNEFSKKFDDTKKEHNYKVVFGDLNIRMDNLTRDEIIDNIKEKDYESLR